MEVEFYKLLETLNFSLSLLLYVLFYHPVLNIPESVASLKKENQVVKAQIDSRSDTVKGLQTKVDQDLRYCLEPTLVILPMKTEVESL